MLFFIPKILKGRLSKETIINGKVKHYKLNSVHLNGRTSRICHEISRKERRHIRKKVSQQSEANFFVPSSIEG